MLKKGLLKLFLIIFVLSYILVTLYGIGASEVVVEGYNILFNAPIEQQGDRTILNINEFRKEPSLPILFADMIAITWENGVEKEFVLNYETIKTKGFRVHEAFGNETGVFDLNNGVREWTVDVAANNYKIFEDEIKRLNLANYGVASLEFTPGMMITEMDKVNQLGDGTLPGKGKPGNTTSKGN